MWRLAVLSIVGVGLGSCGTLPKGGAGPVVSTASIVEAVRCQLYAVFAPGNPDPAGIVGWKVLTTITVNGDDGYEIRPGLAGVAGKAGAASWKAPASGFSAAGSTRRKTETEYKVRSIGEEVLPRPCPAPGGPASTQGLDIAHWLRAWVAGQPSPDTGASPRLASYTRTFRVSASAGGGLTFTFADFSLSFESNKAEASTMHTIDVRLGPQTGPTAPFMGGENFGLNEFGEFDAFSDLRRERDRDEEEDTIIKVPPGQSIVIGP